MKKPLFLLFATGAISLAEARPVVLPVQDARPAQDGSNKTVVGSKSAAATSRNALASSKNAAVGSKEAVVGSKSAVAGRSDKVAVERSGNTTDSKTGGGKTAGSSYGERNGKMTKAAKNQ